RGGRAGGRGRLGWVGSLVGVCRVHRQGGGVGVEVVQPVQSGAPLVRGRSTGGGEGVDEVVEAVAARGGRLEQVDLRQSLQQPPGVAGRDVQQGGQRVGLELDTWV